MVERSTPFHGPVDVSAPGVTMSGVARGSLWQVAAWWDTFSSVETALALACGCAAPGPGRCSETQDGRLLIRVEPLKWWVMGPDGADCPLVPDPDDGASLDLSHDQAAIRLAGSGAAELLKRMVSLDLRPHAFVDRSFATTHMHHMITRVMRCDEDGQPTYQVMVMRSYADDLAGIAAHHAHAMA